MPLVVDANVVISALITDSKSRELIVTLEQPILTPEIVHDEIDRAEDAIADIDPDDVLYLACALARDAAIWSDDSDFEEQSLVQVYKTNEIVESFAAN